MPPALAHVVSVHGLNRVTAIGVMDSNTIDLIILAWPPAIVVIEHPVPVRAGIGGQLSYEHFIPRGCIWVR